MLLDFHDVLVHKGIKSKERINWQKVLL